MINNKSKIFLLMFLLMIVMFLFPKLLLACSEDWVAEYSSCEINDTQIITYTDNNQCGTYDNLSIDNGTSVECNYCTEDIIESHTACVDGTWTVSYDDDNFFSCCYITNIYSDCSILENPEYIEARENCTNPENIGPQCQTNLTNEFNCSYDSIPIMQKKMNVICNLPNEDYIILGSFLFENDFKCVVNILQNKTLLSSSPEYKEATGGTIFNREGDTRLSFKTTSGIMNGYYTTKNLRTDTPFTLQVLCSNYSTSLKSEYCITPTYIKPDWILNIWVWAKDNMAFIIILSLSLMLLIGIGIYYLKRM